ncbi:MAG: hypothetical protein ACYCX0_09390, partial [Desulfurivibrionaceae bacterium]
RTAPLPLAICRFQQQNYWGVYPKMPPIPTPLFPILAGISLSPWDHPELSLLFSSCSAFILLHKENRESMVA